MKNCAFILEPCKIQDFLKCWRFMSLVFIICLKYCWWNTIFNNFLPGFLIKTMVMAIISPFSWHISIFLRNFFWNNVWLLEMIPTPLKLGHHVYGIPVCVNAYVHSMSVSVCMCECACVCVCEYTCVCAPWLLRPR